MKQSNLTFSEGFLGTQSEQARKQSKPMMFFDWDKAASIINEKIKLGGVLVAEAGLQGDWDYTGGIIFESNEPVTDSYTYLSSNWAVPTLIIDIDGMAEELECFTTDENTRFDSGSKWDKESLKILLK